MRRARIVLLALVLLALALIGIARAPALDQMRVQAGNYREFWLWGGVKGRPWLDRAEALYLLQGEIGPDPLAGGAIGVTAQSAVSPGPHKAPIWLVYRIRSLDFGADVYDVLRARLARWRREPGEISGVQIDFDAATRGLARYSVFLRELRGQLPPGLKISVTGLMDWAAQAQPEDINALAGAVDEIVFQTYSGRTTIADIDAYMRRLPRLKIAFKLGLVEGGNWREPAELAKNPLFRGYVVFLRNPAGYEARP